ncbi:gasdermin-B [Canis lupus baileyi]|uniref:gasdermin-B n=1 Tax=Canis lupus dingo TaxID=286419 RepID=UPI0015F14E66|nr:gasdermin-B [Canis lupus dingo]XP_038474963.1 gasdermin-B isoform X4 [Canis lupus familiaris]
MSSIFEEITRVVVQEMDTGGDMIAIRSILHVDRFHCCSLVRGRRNFWGHQYHRTDLILEDTLERGEGEELFEKLDSGPQGQKLKFQVLDTGDSKGMLTVKLPKEVTIARALHKSHKQKVQMLETHIPQQYLDFLELREAGVGQRGGGEHPFWAPRASEVEEGFSFFLVSLQETFLYPQLTFLLPSRVIDSSDLDQNMHACFKRPLSFVLLQSCPDMCSVQFHSASHAPLLCGLVTAVFFNAAEFLVKTHIESILDILDNLIELSEEQCLMAKAPEKGTLPLLKDQVESVLEQICSEQPQAVGCDPDV